MNEEKEPVDRIAKVDRKPLQTALTRSRRVKTDQTASIMDLLEPLFRRAEAGTFGFTSPWIHRNDFERVVSAIDELSAGEPEITLASPENVRIALGEKRMKNPAWVEAEQFSTERMLARRLLGYEVDVEGSTDPIMAQVEELLWNDLFVGLLRSICAVLEPTQTKPAEPVGDWLSIHRPLPPEPFEPDPKPKKGLKLDHVQCPDFWRGLESSLTNAIFLAVMGEITGKPELLAWRPMVEAVGLGWLPLRIDDAEWWLVGAK